MSETDVSDATSYQRLREHLAAELDRGLDEQASPTQVPECPLEIEIAATRARRQRARLRSIPHDQCGGVAKS